MMQRARQLSDIRSPNAPAFRLKAAFSFVSKDLETVQGTYTEVWVSSSQWRRETVVNNLRRVEVGGPTRRWLLDSTDEFPDHAARVPRILQILPSIPVKFEFAAITEHAQQEPMTECAITKRGSDQEVSAFCFDKKSGLLIQRIFPEERPSHAVAHFRIFEHSCSYGTFQKLGNFWFPREMICFEDRHREIALQVTELSVEPSPDSALFTPPAGATELANCRALLVPPKPITTPQPSVASGSTTQSHVDVVLLVDTKGQPQHLRVVTSGGKNLDGDALAAVRRWRFSPATCEGEAVPVQIFVGVDFRLFR
jgi:TonB family protein